MVFFLFFVVFGAVMYLLDWWFLRLRGGVWNTSYLLSGAITGLGGALLLHRVYPLSVLGFLVVFLVAFCGGVVLMLAQMRDLYRFSLFQVLGTLILAAASGFLAWILMKVLFWGGLISLQDSLQLRRPLLNFLVYAFLLQFGYAFTGRVVRLGLRRRPS